MNLSWFDLIILIIIIVSLIKGYISGLVKQMASLAGIVVCAIFSGQVAAFLSPYIIEISDAPGYMVKPLSYVLAFIVIMVVFVFLGKLIEGVLKTIKINILNKFAGSVFSVGKWLIIASILLNVTVELDKNKKLIGENVRQNSYSYAYIKEIAPYFIPFLGFDDDSKS